MSIATTFSGIQNYFSSPTVQNQTVGTTTVSAPQITSSTSYPYDAVKTNYPTNSAIPTNSFNTLSTDPQTAAFKPEDLDPNLIKAMKEGAKIKGVTFGIQYMAAGIALGLGCESSLLNFVPGIAGKAPALLGISSTFGKAAITGLVSGAIGASIGAAKGALDGAIVTYAPNKGIAMAAVAVTTGLSNLPLLKVGPTIGWTSVGISGAVGAYYGSFLYDEARKK